MMDYGKKCPTGFIHGDSDLYGLGIGDQAPLCDLPISAFRFNPQTKNFEPPSRQARQVLGNGLEIGNRRSNTSADLSATSSSLRFVSNLNSAAFAVVNREIVYH
jgi:hypothetical protein